MIRVFVIAALLSGCAATLSRGGRKCPPAWSQAVDFVAGGIAAGAAVAAFNATPSHDGTVAALIVAETFWLTSAFAEDACRR